MNQRDHDVPPPPEGGRRLHPLVYESLFGAYPDALLMVDRAGTIVLANPAAASLLGYAPHEFIGMPIDALVPDEVRTRHSAYRQAYGMNPRPRPMGTQMELSARCRDGTEVMVEIALSPLEDDGIPYVVAAVRAIGAYPRVRQALQRARYNEVVAQFGRLAVDARDPQALIDALPVMAAEALGAEGGILFQLEPNAQEFRVIHRFGKHCDQIGLRMPNRPDTPPGYVLSQGTPVIVSNYPRETRFIVPMAYLEAGLVSGVSVPVTDRGRQIGVLSVCSMQAQRFGDDEVHFLQSMSSLLATRLQRAQTEEQLRHSQKMESVGQLSGGIAHDFNNLLTVIMGNLQALQEHPALAGRYEVGPMLDAALRASQRGAELTSKLLAFSRRQMLVPEPVDVRVLLDSLAGMLRRTFDQRVRIETHVHEGCPPCLADPGQLESALLNLAINARDAMPAGGTLHFEASLVRTLPMAVRAEISLRSDGADAVEAAEGAEARGPAPGYVCIAVHDTGTGMPPAVRERAFEPFFTTKDAGRGTGLGLSTVYGFIRQSRGAIAIDSEVGAGTTVTLYVPMYAGPGPGGGAPGAGVAELPRNLRVVLVEDDLDVLGTAMTMLQALGCSVEAYTRAEDALADIDERALPDLLLTDVALGTGMRGTDLARAAQQRFPQLPVLLMSGYSSELLGSDVSDGPPWELLRKPYSRDELAQAVARVLAEYRK